MERRRWRRRRSEDTGNDVSICGGHIRRSCRHDVPWNMNIFMCVYTFSSSRVGFGAFALIGYI